MPRCLHAACLAFAALLTGAALVSDLASKAHAAAPAPAASLASHRTVTEWVRAGAVPDEPQDVDPTGTAAAAVFLRLAGDTVGKGTAVDDSGRAIWMATRRAWAMASERAAAERDALRAERLVEFAQSLTVEVQLGGPWTPIPTGSFAQAAARVLPGVQGVGVRSGESVAVVFPGEMLSTNTNPAQAISVAASEVGLPPATLETLMEEHAARVYVFDVVQVGQTDPRGGATFFHRGGRVTPLSAVSVESLHALADRLAGNLAARAWPGEEPFGLMGTYRPWIGDFEPPILASAREQALAAFAIAEWASLNGPRAGEWRRAARSILQAIVDVAEGEEDPASDPLAGAMFVLAFDSLSRQEDRPPVDPIALTASRCTVAITAPGLLESLDPPAAAVVAYASAKVRAASTSGAVADAVRSVYRGQTAAQLPALMPWAGWAELELAAQAADRGEPAGVPSAVALREMRRLVERHQVTATNFGASHPDLVGGVVFTSGESPLPSWQCIRPLAFLATMLREPILTDENERAAATASVISGLRFVMELTVDEADAHQFPRRDSLLGGVRSALWDSTMPIDATSLALLFVTESLKSLSQPSGE